MIWIFIRSGGFILWLVEAHSAFAFHPNIYTPRVPQEQMDRVLEIENPLPMTRENIQQGREIYFGKGLCVTCHGNNGQGVNMPGHSPRNFTDGKWQDLRTDGELMWVLKNGSPGTAMPVRVGNVITPEEGWQVINFIRTFLNLSDSKWFVNHISTILSCLNHTLIFFDRRRKFGESGVLVARK